MAFNDKINVGEKPNDGKGDGFRTTLIKLHENTLENQKTLKGENGNVASVLSTEGISVLKPNDGIKDFGTSVLTGAIKIRLPQSWIFTMVKLKVSIYDYASDGAFDVTLAGFLYDRNGGYWANTSAIITTSVSNQDFTVRFGHDNEKCCIYLGELNSSWTFLKVSITEGMFSFQNSEVEKWLTGWDISMETKSFQNITLTHESNLPVAKIITTK